MLVHVKRDELLAIAAQTAKAAPKTATSEAVLGIHVEADSRRSMLTLTATNYEIVIRASMGASVEQSGSVVISAALFPAAIASLPEQDVDLETEHPGQLTIRSGHARFRLSALSGDKYPMPELPFPDDTLPVSGLRSLARNTLFAVAEDGVPSPPMKCVRLHVGPDGLKASASNGFCIMEADGDKQCKGQIELLLPARSLKVLASLSNDSDVYEMGVTGKSLVFWSGTLLFSARLVEGKFPNTSGIFEQFKCQYSVHLDAAEFIRALEVAESVSESNHRVELTFGEHEIRTDQVVNALTAVETALPPDPFIDQFPGKDDRGIAGQEIEELELQSCKGELTSAHCDPLAQGVHHQIFINDTARRCGLRRVFIGRRTAKQGTDSGRALLGTVFRKAHIKPSVHKSRPNIRFTDWEHK